MKVSTVSKGLLSTVVPALVATLLVFGTQTSASIAADDAADDAAGGAHDSVGAQAAECSQENRYATDNITPSDGDVKWGVVRLIGKGACKLHKNLEASGHAVEVFKCSVDKTVRMIHTDVTRCTEVVSPEGKSHTCSILVNYAAGAAEPIKPVTNPCEINYSTDSSSVVGVGNL